MSDKFNWSRYETDKLAHGYDTPYDKYLAEHRLEVKSVVEIGSRPGSAALWLDYFPNATIYCIDLVPFNIPNERYKYLKLDQGNPATYDMLLSLEESFDVIIDDGPHSSPEQLLFLEHFLPRVSSNGWYLIEDLHCTDGANSQELAKFKKDSDITLNSLLKEWANNTYNSYKYIDSSKLSNLDIEIYFDRGTKIRWHSGSQKQSVPSEFVAIQKLN